MTTSIRESSASCPACGSAGLLPFYQSQHVPVQSMLLLDTPAEARAFPCGNITLAVCHTCGLIYNIAFDPATQEYSEKYEASQGFSATFNAFHRRLAQQLIERYDLAGKRVIEIGCGQGEFLALLCELGVRSGVGFDPVYSPERAGHDPRLDVTIIKDLYSERYAGYQADLVCCKMTLEHIHRPAELITTIRRAIGGDAGTVVFFQIPSVIPILHEGAFWEIYYEHCAYYSPGTLARLFRRCGFVVTDLWTDYDGQYLMIEARVAHPGRALPLALEEQPADLVRLVERFDADARAAIECWRARLSQLRAAGRRVVLWGSGSRGVGFLTSLGVEGAVSHVVDINPYRQGKYMAGTGQPIVAPALLAEYRPDAVIIMNPIYRDEIRRDLERLGLAPELLVP